MYKNTVNFGVTSAKISGEVICNPVFSTSNDISIGWNGTTAAGDAPKGGYVYIIKYKDLKGKAHTEKGSLLLLR